MLGCAFEHSCIGNVRYTGEGSRELILCPYNAVYECQVRIGKLSNEEITISEEYTPYTVVKHFFCQSLPEADVEAMGIIKRCPMYAGTVGPGTVIVVPAGWTVMDRAIGGTGALGWRVHVIEDNRVGQRVQKIKDQMLTYSTAETNGVLKMFDEVLSTIATRGARDARASSTGEIKSQWADDDDHGVSQTVPDLEEAEGDEEDAEGDEEDAEGDDAHFKEGKQQQAKADKAAKPVIKPPSWGLSKVKKKFGAKKQLSFSDAIALSLGGAVVKKRPAAAAKPDWPPKAAKTAA